ncbi:MAG: hypothetical protein QNJ98_12270 [Planctomycetota bacterium]|nr:hypothetical protein [Planctomycetota bacterium]
MTERMPTAVTSWPAQAERLARRCTRRARLGVLLPRLAAGVLLGAVPALACRLVPAFAPAAPLAPWCVLAGAAIGLVMGLRRARALAPVRMADAAWALDRVGALDERGLTAATVEGPRGAEAAWAAPALATPPTVRLLPPKGLALLVGSVLVAGIALVALPASAASTAESDAAPATAAAPAAPAAASAAAPPADTAASLEDAAVETEAVGARAEAVARALELPTDELVDPADLADRLADPELRKAAADAAAGTPLESAFASGGNVAERLARALNNTLGPADRAEDQRRDAVALRALDPRAPVPPHRRDVVERYYELEGDRR